MLYLLCVAAWYLFACYQLFWKPKKVAEKSSILIPKNNESKDNIVSKKFATHRFIPTAVKHKKLEAEQAV